MATLADFLGQLMTEITNARMQADQETIRLAHLYASDDLLKHLPVPHFRLPEVTLDIPIFVQSVGVAPAVPRETLVRRMQGAFERTVRSEFEKAGRPLALSEWERMRPAVLRAMDEVRSGKVDLHPGRVASALAAAAAKAVPAREGDKVAAPWPAVREQAASAMAAGLPAPGALDVVATTSAVRDVAKPETLLRIKLTVREQNVEWASVGEGEENKRLVQE